MKKPKPMTKRELAAEAAFAEESYRDRARLNHKAQEILAGSRPVTIRLNNSEIALAKRQAESKGLKYQTYVKMLLHQALHSASAAPKRSSKALSA